LKNRKEKEEVEDFSQQLVGGGISNSTLATHTKLVRGFVYSAAH
jgi:hypothetical protein